MSKKLFVGNLPFDVNDADLSTVMAVAGKVVDAKVIINKKTGRSKGYGFVEMETDEMALDAVSKFEGATLNERPLTVQITTPKQEAAAKSDEDGEIAPVAAPAGMIIKPKAESVSAEKHEQSAPTPEELAAADAPAEGPRDSA